MPNTPDRRTPQPGSPEKRKPRPLHDQPLEETDDDTTQVSANPVNVRSDREKAMDGASTDGQR